MRIAILAASKAQEYTVTNAEDTQTTSVVRGAGLSITQFLRGGGKEMPEIGYVVS